LARSPSFQCKAARQPVARPAMRSTPTPKQPKHGARRVLVTGADQHQVLAVIRGLGLKGVPVVACGSETRSLGFYSRFTQQRYVYPSQHGARERFIDAILKFLGGRGAEMHLN